MQAGKLRERIKVEAYTATRDAGGGEVRTWSTFAANVPAAYDPLSGRELVNLKMERSQVTVRFRIRFLAGLTSKMRIVFRDRLYSITDVLPDALDSQQEILAFVEAAGPLGAAP